MKKVLFSVISLVLAFLASAGVQSCSSSSYESPLTGQNVSDITMESTEGSYDVSLGNSNLTKIKALSSETWCVPSVSSNSIHLSILANDTYEERKAMIVLTDSEDGSMLHFNVLQKQNNAIETFSSEYLMYWEGGPLIIPFQTTVDFNVEIPDDCDWLKDGIGNSRTRGMHRTEIIVTAQPNTGIEHRRVTFNIVNHSLGLSAPITIYQLSKGQPYPL